MNPWIFMLMIVLISSCCSAPTPTPQNQTKSSFEDYLARFERISPPASILPAQLIKEGELIHIKEGQQVNAKGEAFVDRLLPRELIEQWILPATTDTSNALFAWLQENEEDLNVDFHSWYQVLPNVRWKWQQQDVLLLQCYTRGDGPGGDYLEEVWALLYNAQQQLVHTKMVGRYAGDDVKTFEDNDSSEYWRREDRYSTLTMQLLSAATLVTTNKHYHYINHQESLPKDTIFENTTLLKTVVNTLHLFD